MTREEKKKKAALIAVSYFLDQEKAELVSTQENKNSWSRVGKEMIMKKRNVVQRRGRLLHSA